VSHFLDQLLHPIFDRVAKQTTFINGIHFVRRLELYRDIGRLSPTTTFITFDVADLYTMIPRDGALLKEGSKHNYVTLFLFIDPMG
jgi:dimeric dUTPase (all-alpha-NTP-PPase superfamily)